MRIHQHQQDNADVPENHSDAHYPNHPKIKRLESQNLNTFQVLNLTEENLEKILMLKKRKTTLQLKDLLTRTKVKLLGQNFIRKLKRNIVRSTIPENIIKQQEQKNHKSGSFAQQIQLFLSSIDGFKTNKHVKSLLSFLKLTTTILMTVLFTMTLAFPQISNSQLTYYMRIFNISGIIINVFLSLTLARYQEGKNIINLKEIFAYYFRTTSFILDICTFLVSVVDLTHHESFVVAIMVFLMLIKLKIAVSEFQKFSYLYISSSERQRYYGLLKIFLLNFFIGHILSIALNLMAYLQPNDNWYLKVSIQDDIWIVKYVWGYYWGTTIMLTVGFGDLCASNTKQAVCLIFIETLSCITLAYNISQVGSLINEMNIDTNIKNKKLKYFHKMAQQNALSHQIQNKITNFIEQSYQMKQNFQFEEYQQIITSLPKYLQIQYRQQANQKLFNVPFFNMLNKITLIKLAENVVKKVALPDQIIQKKGEIPDFTILQKGQIGLCCRNKKSKLNGQVLAKIQILDNQIQKILTLDFIRETRLKYDIKSLNYSIIYSLKKQEFMDCLRVSDMDFQLLFMMRDKDDHILDSLQIYSCESCTKEYHNKFNCPKYHYIPFKQRVILASISKQKQTHQIRKRQDRVQLIQKKALAMLKQLARQQERYILNCFGQKYYHEGRNIQSYLFRSKQITKRKQQSMSEQQQPSPNDKFMVRQFQKFQELLMKQHVQDHDFWKVEVDGAKNYKFYFPDYNPDRLIFQRLIRKNKNSSQKNKSLMEAIKKLSIRH